MKILRLDLLRYGLFTDASLDLSGGDHGLHVIFGQNEAGKSTMLRALTSLLFGIEQRTRDGYLHDMTQLRIGGHLRRVNGEEFDFVRRKGRTKTLLTPGDETPVDDSRLVNFVSGVDRNLFTTLYGIGHSDLVEGGKAILEERGELGHALFSAALGTARLRTLLDNLNGVAAELFKPTGTKPTINALKREYAEAKKAAKEATLSSNAWAALQREIKALEQDTASTKQTLDETQIDQNRLRRVQRILRPMGNLEELLTELETLGDVVELPEGFGEERRATAGDLRAAEEQRALIDVKLANIGKQRDELDVDEDLLAKADEVQELAELLGTFKKAKRDHPAQVAKRQQMRSQAREALALFRPDMDLNQVTELKPQLARRRVVDDLANKALELTTEERTSQKSIRDIKTKLEQLDDDLANQPRVVDSSLLATAVSTARAAGDLDTRVEELTAFKAEAQENCELGLQRLGLWVGNLEEFESLSLPLTETVDEFENRLSAVLEQGRDIERRKREQDSNRNDLERKLAELNKGDDVPTHEQLQESRAHRSRGWHLVRRNWIDGEDVTADAEAFAGDRSLPEAYESSVEEADGLADLMYREVGHVEQYRSLTAGLVDIDTALGVIEKELSANQAQVEQLESEWRLVWEAPGVEPLSPREMRAWLQRADALRIQAGELRKYTTDLDRLQGSRESVQAELREVLAAAGLEPPPPSSALAPLLFFAEERLSELLQGEKEIHDIGSRRKDVAANLVRAEQDDREIGEQRKRWQVEWEAAVSWLALPDEASTAEIILALDHLETVFSSLDEATRQDKRIWGIEQDIKEFNEKVVAFVEGTGAAVGERTPEELIKQLSQNRADAVKESERSHGLVEQQRTLTEEQAELDARIEAKKAHLGELMQQAAVENEEDLDEAERRSTRRRELLARQGELLRVLKDNGDGHSVEKLKEQASGQDIDALPGAIEEVENRVGELMDELEQHREARSDLKAREQEHVGGDAAAEAEERANRLLAQMRSEVERYLRARTAAYMLKDQIERFRRENQTPLLTRASELFAKLTLNGYKGLRDDVDGKGTPIVLGVRPDDLEVPVEGMSDGTCDQLFLSLRLAALEQHLEKGEPMPFVVDDILIGFDDERSKGALRVLGELASKTQVLLFTHHRRVVELAREVKPEAGVFIHELG